jgi:hypothetical protein
MYGRCQKLGNFGERRERMLSPLSKNVALRLVIATANGKNLFSSEFSSKLTGAYISRGGYVRGGAR